MAQTEKKMSRQRRWQIAKIAIGRCARCGKKRSQYKVYCDACQVKHRDMKRRVLAARRLEKGL